MFCKSLRRITVFLRERVAVLDDPRRIGEAFKGSRLGEFWKYRVGDYCIIGSIEEGILRIIIVRMRESQRGIPEMKHPYAAHSRFLIRLTRAEQRFDVVTGYFSPVLFHHDSRAILQLLRIYGQKFFQMCRDF